MALSKERFCIWLRKGNCALIGCVADCNKLRKKLKKVLLPRFVLSLQNGAVRFQR